MITKSYELPSGILAVEILREDSGYGDGSLFEVAARRNPKRAFLFVSTVLGRHIPVSPGRMRRVHDALARKLRTDLEGPILFIGMAETAVGLGLGTFDAYLRATGRRDCLFLPSTRHPVSDRFLATFTEDHSHATRHLLHMPDGGEAERILDEAATLVMIDDEMTTGRTFENLEAAVRAACPTIRAVERVVIKDWSGSEPGAVHSMLAGRYRWDPTTNPPTILDPGVDVTARGTAPIAAEEWGRKGVTTTETVPFVTAAAGRHLVLGTGEYVWPAFVHALGLERHLDATGKGTVRFAATTRSPIFVGGAIRSAFGFSDNYGLGIPNYLYNVEPGDFDHVHVFTETPPEYFDPAFVGRYAPTFVVPSRERAAA